MPGKTKTKPKARVLRVTKVRWGALEVRFHETFPLEVVLAPRDVDAEAFAKLQRAADKHEHKKNQRKDRT